MIRDCKKPSVFNMLDNECNFAEFYNGNGEVYGYAAFDLSVTEFATLHLELSRFSVTIFKELLEDWEIIKKQLRKANVNTVVTTQEVDGTNHDQWLRFIELFGFNKIDKIICVSQRI